MSGPGPRSVGDLMRSGDISRIRTEATERRQLADRVRSELPAAEAGHVISAHIDDAGVLVLGIDSAAWAASIRYSTASLLGRKIKVRVAVPGGSDRTAEPG